MFEIHTFLTFGLWRDFLSGESGRRCGVEFLFVLLVCLRYTPFYPSAGVTLFFPAKEEVSEFAASRELIKNRLGVDLPL